MLLDPDELKQFKNHTSQMAALDFMVSTASNIFIPTYDGNMARLVEGHRRYQQTQPNRNGAIILIIYLQLNSLASRRYLGFKKTIKLDRRTLVRLIDLHQNQTLDWNNFSASLKSAHENRTGQPTLRKVILDKPKEEDYFYANPYECLCEEMDCGNSEHSSNTTVVVG